MILYGNHRTHTQSEKENTAKQTTTFTQNTTEYLKKKIGWEN